MTKESVVNSELIKTVTTFLKSFKEHHRVTSKDKLEYIVSVNPVFVGLTIHRESGITEIIRYIREEGEVPEYVMFNPNLDSHISAEYAGRLGLAGVSLQDISKYFCISMDLAKDLIDFLKIQKEKTPEYQISSVVGSEFYQPESGC